MTEGHSGPSRLFDRFPADGLLSLRDRAQPGAVPDELRGRRLPAVVVTAREHSTGAGEAAIYVQLAVHTGAEQCSWARIDDYLMLERPPVATMIRRAAELEAREEITPGALLGAQVEVLLGRWPDDRWRVRRWLPLLAPQPRPAAEALALEEGEERIVDGVIDDVELARPRLRLWLLLEPSAAGDDPVGLLHAALISRDLEVVGRRVMKETGADLAFQPGDLLRQRCRVRVRRDHGCRSVEVLGILPPSEGRA